MGIYLYIKIHNITGLKYFGKTCQDPFKYSGSGVYWKNHIKHHGNDVTTEIIGYFDNTEECEIVALNFSKTNNIVESVEWANLIEENGCDGAPKGHPGHKFTPEQIEKISKSSLDRWQDPLYREAVIASHKARWTPELKQKQSERLTGKFRPEHSEKMSGRTLSEETKQKLRKPKCIGHRQNISKALKGKPKTDAHKKALSKPKVRVCRLMDKKEMSINHFTRWLNKLPIPQEE